MRRISLRFPRWSRILFSVAFLLSLSTGLLWFSLDRWGEIEGEFGPEKHPWLAFVPKIHGGGAFISLISIGMILSSHIPPGWRAGWSRKSGIFILLCVAMIVVSAWGLYYAGTDELREKLVWLHLAAGCLLPVSIVIHLRSRKLR
jgi:hypothetical protein